MFPTDLHIICERLEGDGVAPSWEILKFEQFSDKTYLLEVEKASNEAEDLEKDLSDKINCEEFSLYSCECKNKALNIYNLTVYKVA